MKELEVEKELRLQAERRGWKCLKLNPLWYVGIPDRLILASRGRALFVETKTIGGRMKSKQERWRQWLLTMGFRIEVIWTIEHVHEFCRSLD